MQVGANMRMGVFQLSLPLPTAMIAVTINASG